MRILLMLALALSACDDAADPVQQYMSGAAAVDGVPCCGALAMKAPPPACSDGDRCIGEPGVSCRCSGHSWVCGDPPHVPDLAVRADLATRD
jgi:hypothetical protein